MQIINNTAQYSELKRMQSQLDADASNAQRLQNTLENLKGIKGKEHIPTAAKGFESLFIYRMLEEMRKTVPQNSLFGDSFGMDVFMSMLDEKVANRIAESGRFGISSMLIDYLEKKMEREEAAVDSQKARNTETKIQKESSIKTESNTDDTTKTLSPSSSGSLDIMERIQSFMHHINEAAEKYKIDPDLIKAVIAQESAGNPNAVSKSGAKGLMQLMDATADELNVKNIFDPRENIIAGARYLKKLLETFQGDISQVLAAYNAGPNTVQLYGGVPPYSETQNYIQKVINFRDVFRSAEPF